MLQPIDDETQVKISLTPTGFPFLSFPPLPGSAGPAQAFQCRWGALQCFGHGGCGGEHSCLSVGGIAVPRACYFMLHACVGRYKCSPGPCHFCVPWCLHCWKCLQFMCVLNTLCTPAKNGMINHKAIQFENDCQSDTFRIED